LFSVIRKYEVGINSNRKSACYGENSSWVLYKLPVKCLKMVCVKIMF